MKQEASSEPRPFGPLPEEPSGHVMNATTRRQVLLRTLGKGSAILAAGAPIKSLASTASVLPNGKICSISGQHSAVHSATSLAKCGGWSPGRYKKTEHWPSPSSASGAGPYAVTSPSRGPISFDKDTWFSAVFGGGGEKPLIYIMLNEASSDEFHWIPALLNSILAPSGYVFPYSSTEVLGFYEAGGLERANALAFFKDWMEGV